MTSSFNSPESPNIKRTPPSRQPPTRGGDEDVRRFVRSLSLTSIFTEATTTSQLKLGRESFLLWRSAVYRYCRSAFDVDIGAGPGWTLAWRPRHDENERMVYPAWFDQTRDPDLYDFVLLTSDPAHELRYNNNNPSRSGLQAVFNICQVYEESAVITMERGLAALRAIQQQDCLDGEAFNLYSTQLAQAAAVLKELPKDFDWVEGLIVSTIIRTAPTSPAVEAIIGSVLTGASKIDSLAILLQISGSFVNHKSARNQHPNANETALLAAQPTKTPLTPGAPAAPTAPRTYTNDCLRCGKGAHLVIDCTNPPVTNWHARVPTKHKKKIAMWEAKIAARATAATPALSGYLTSPRSPPALPVVTGAQHTEEVALPVALPVLPALLTANAHRASCSTGRGAVAHS
jgi:hypothetical protein